MLSYWEKVSYKSGLADALGTAAICLLSEHMTVIRQRIDMPIPRKRKGSTTVHEKAMDNFFATVYAAILRLLPFQTLRAIVIASPGFTKEAVSSNLARVLLMVSFTTMSSIKRCSLQTKL